MVTGQSTSQPGERESREGLYRLLARLWFQEVDLPLLEQLHALDSDLIKDSIELPEASPESVERLSIDFCQLFIGPKGHLPPLQSVWESGQFSSQTLVAMQRYHDLVGYVPLASLPESVLDHLGLQFDFMAHLLLLRSNATELDQQRALEEIEAAYFAAHLSWPTNLLTAASAKATTPFYRSVVSLTQQFLETEKELDEPIRPSESAQDPSR